MNLKLPNHKPNRKLNRYLGFPPAKRANPIRLVVSLGGSGQRWSSPPPGSKRWIQGLTISGLLRLLLCRFLSADIRVVPKTTKELQTEVLCVVDVLLCVIIVISDG